MSTVARVFRPKKNNKLVIHSDGDNFHGLASIGTPSKLMLRVAQQVGISPLGMVYSLSEALNAGRRETLFHSALKQH